MSSSQSSKRKWLIIGCGALAAVVVLCACIIIIIGRTPSTPTPIPTEVAIPTDLPTGTPIPQPTEPPTVTPTPEQFVTIDGYDPASDSIIDPINLWVDYNDRAAGIAAKAHHGDPVKLIQREGDGILVETQDSIQGWVTYWFIKEFKDEYLSTIITATLTSLPIPIETPTSPPVITNTSTPTMAPSPTDTPAPPPTENCPYIGNSNTKKFHHAGCSSVGEMKEEHKVCFPSREEAIANGYVPCKRCNP